MGAAFYSLAGGDLPAARAAARWMAERAWARRAELATAPTFTPREALEHATRAPRGSILLLDVGDNVGAGSAGDTTFILAEAQRLGARSLLQTVRDPEAVEARVAAGVGSMVTLSLGGKTDALHGETVTVSGYVRLIADGRFEEPEPIYGGFRYFNNGISVVLLLVNTAGAASADLSTFAYHRRRRPPTRPSPTRRTRDAHRDERTGALVAIYCSSWTEPSRRNSISRSKLRRNRRSWDTAITVPAYSASARPSGAARTFATTRTSHCGCRTAARKRYPCSSRGP